MKQSTFKAVGFAAPLSLALAASAEDVGSIALFGTEYAVQRFDYTKIELDNPAFPGFKANLAEVESTFYLGNNRLLMASDGMDSQGAPKNLIIELRYTTDNDGKVTGLQTERVIAWIDPSLPGYGGYDLDPAGITVNSGPGGLGADGDIVIASSAGYLVGYDFDTGEQIKWQPNCGGLGCGIDISANNISCEDGVYVPSRDEFYTIQQDPPFTVQRFSSDGAPAGSFVIAADFDPAFKGDPKGITYLAAGDKFPEPFGGKEAIIAILDDEGPALQAFDLDGNFIAVEPLVDKSGFSLLDPILGNAAQQFESGSADAATGRLFLTLQSDGLGNGYHYILTPKAGAGCYPDLTGDGVLDLFDFLAFVNAFNAADPKADCTEDGTYDLFDFLCFVNAFNTGC